PKIAPLAVLLQGRDRDGLLGGVLRLGLGLKPVIETFYGIGAQRECHTSHDTRSGISGAMIHRDDSEQPGTPCDTLMTTRPARRACGVARRQALLKRLPGDHWRLTPGE